MRLHITGMILSWLGYQHWDTCRYMHIPTTQLPSPAVCGWLTEPWLRPTRISKSDYYNLKARPVSPPQPVPKPRWKCCVKFRTTTSLRTGLIGVIQHSLSEHLKCLKSKTWNDLSSANLFFLERRMRSAAKQVEQSLGYGYLSKMEWFSLRPQLV